MYSWKQAPENTDESVASWGCIIILYQKTKHYSVWEDFIHSFFVMFLIFATNIITYYLLISRYFDEIMKSGPRRHWWVCSFKKMYNKLVTKINSRLLIKRNQVKLFSIFFLRFATNIFTYYIYISRFPDVIMKTGPRELWWSVASWRCIIILYQK